MCVDPGALVVRDRGKRGERARGVSRFEVGLSGEVEGEGWARGVANACVVFDEAWILLDAREWQKNVGRTIGAFLRKFNLFLLMPSVWPVDTRFRHLMVQRILNLGSFGLDGYVYKWGFDLGYVREGGWFALLGRSHMFGLYDDEEAPCDDGGITEAMLDTIPEVVVSGVAGSEFTGEMGGYEGLKRVEGKKKRKRRG
jgi:hypothetical protein